MSKARHVCIINSSPNYVKMFRSMGWKITNYVRGADLVQFTGGADVSPEMYKQHKHKLTQAMPWRDAREALVYNHCLVNGMPMAGICRGGQLLNVLSGGSLWQDVDNHMLGYTGSHMAFDSDTGEAIEVTSTHHQMMIPSAGADIVLWAAETSKRAKMSRDGHEMIARDPNPTDIEALFYPEQRAFCFQPHPERPGLAELKRAYFGYLEKFLFNAGVH